ADEHDLPARTQSHPAAQNTKSQPERMCLMSSVPADEPSASPTPLPTAAPPIRKTPLQTYQANRARLFPDITDEQWNDGKWQQKNRITTLEQVVELFGIDEFTAARLGDVAELYR